MPIVVQKYGGSSVASPEKLRLVARRVMETKRLGHDVVVVVSAMGKTTDDLLELSKRVCTSPERRELDMLLTAGERISMALLSMAIRDEGGLAISFTGSQAGIMTNDRHVDARIIEVRPIRVEDELARGKIVIVAGYQGMSYKREITTLGRGGSDTTAVALAAALNAEWCEICSDVDGVYSADPRVVPNAKRIPELSYEETQELAEAGAKVLNAQAVEFAKEKGIVIYARATTSPPVESATGGDGSLVRRFPPGGPGRVTGVTSESGIVLLRGQIEDPQPLLAAMDDVGIPGKQLQIVPNQAGIHHISLVISGQNLTGLPAFRSTLADRFGDQFTLRDGFAAVSVIGAGINATHANLRRGIETLAGREIAEIFTSSFRISWIVPETGADDVVRTLHDAFVP